MLGGRMSQESPDRRQKPTEYRLSEVRCSSCGQPLGEPPADHCPSCGQITDSAPVTRQGGPLPELTHGRIPSEYDPGGPIPPEWELKCMRCGYNLTGLTSRVCPECGLPFRPRRTWEANRRPKSWFRTGSGEIDSASGEEPPSAGPVRSSAPTVFDPGGPIPPEWNLHCQKCGYNLTGLTSRVCPECGTAFRPRETYEANRFGKARVLPTVRMDREEQDADAPKPRPLDLPMPTVFDLGGPIPADWELRCTKCGYDLTGLTTRTCPECGRRFNPRQTWEANRRPRFGTLPVSKEELAVGAVGGAIAAVFCWGGCPLSFLITLTWAMILLWILLELHAFAAGRGVSHVRMFFASFVIVVLLRWLL